MDENRPALCRNRLKDEGKPHPRSGCNVCRNGGMMGCPHERAEAKDRSAPTRGEHEWMQFHNITCCRHCGNVKRRDGKPQKPCKGNVTVSLRNLGRGV